MNDGKDKLNITGLDPEANKDKRRQAMRERCEEYRSKLKSRDPQELARLAAVAFEPEEDGSCILSGDHLQKTFRIHWPSLLITDQEGNPASLNEELLWLHYLERADGHSLAGRWVNLSEIGGLFYQQAFQGYCGDELAEMWENNLEGLKKACQATGGWPLHNLGDLAFEWRVLPKLPLCLCYRAPAENRGAWATMLFDAAANHYAAADVAAIVGKDLADKIMGKKLEERIILTDR